MFKIQFWKFIFPIHQYYFTYKEEKKSLWFTLFGVEEVIQSSEKIPKFYWTAYDTGITNLNDSMEGIFQTFSPTKRNEIKRAEKEWIKYEQIVFSETSLKVYVDFYSKFSKQKNLSWISLKFLLRFKWHLLITRALYEDTTLVYHLFLVNWDYIRLFQSCSLFRDEDSLLPKSMISWANNGLHFFDLNLSKNLWYETHDWWGIYNGLANTPDSIQKLNISQFKLWFTPSLVTHWNNIRYGFILSLIINLWKRFF